MAPSHPPMIGNYWRVHSLVDSVHTVGRYSHNRMKTADTYSAGAHMEGDAYYRIFAGVALSFLENNADAKTALDAISAKMSYALAEGDLTVKDDHCDVKAKVEAMYVDLELDCDMVGIMSSLPTDCATNCWTNMGVEHYFYIPQSRRALALTIPI